MYESRCLSRVHPVLESDLVGRCTRGIEAALLLRMRVVREPGHRRAALAEQPMQLEAPEHADRVACGSS
jgi:hypothetical protein